MAFVPAPGYQPTYNPTLPYNQPIPGGLSAGMSVYIQGVAKENMKRFQVNFMVGQDPGADIAFHFNPRFDGWDKVVFNTKQGGQWGNEEKKRSMPFSKGTHFELVFMVLDEHYKRPVTTPAYPGSGFGPGYGTPPMSSLPIMQGPPTFNPPVPYTGRLQGGLTARKTIIIKGYVPPHSKSFAINLKVSSSGDLALHINPRLGENAVVRNSFLNGSWGSEERKLSYNPFGAGQFFDLSIRCGLDRFKVYANGQHLFDFSHRFTSFQRVDMVEVQGDVTLSYVQI
ncbi:PREDICTED: galectin-4 [Dipodomys ordii]|uniref:Galectin n=1 Tax=Dipodomys ordii TaxID=10020 RepID=A0A1S3FZ54_DIPOR|nr:PREDICTED: galectin-4 [Dipodomys ordii]